MRCEKKKKNKHYKSPEKIKGADDKDGTRTKGIKLLDKLFEEKTAEEILALSKKHDVMGLGPLSMVAAMGHVTGVKKLLEAGVNVNDPSSMDGETPLTLSSRSKHVEVVELLLQHHANIKQTNNEGDNAFMIAIKVGDPKVVNTLWGYRGSLDINHLNKNSISALHYAAERGWESCVQFLVMQGADVNAQDTNGSTPLIVASIRGDQRTVDVLIKAGCNVLIEDNTGCTAVCRALQAEKNTLAQFFLKKFSEQQADVYVKNRAERLRKPEVPSHEVAYYYKHVLFPMLEELSKYENYRDLLFRHKIIPHAILAVNCFVTNPDIMAGVCQIFSVLMYHYPTFVEERFALQFIKSGGPELIVRALKFFNESRSANPSIHEEGICFLPILAACEVPIGREWLQKNSLKVTPFTRNFEVTLDTIDFPHDGSKLKAKVLWTRFRDFFDRMLRTQCEQQEAELLEEEEREKVRREKKREKKRQRRQRQSQLKQDPGAEVELQSGDFRLAGGSLLNLDKDQVISGPLLRDSDNDEEEEITKPGKAKPETMETFVQKMKSMFANPVQKLTNKTSTTRTPLAVPSIGGNKSAVDRAPKTVTQERNRNSSCMNGEATEEHTCVKPKKPKPKPKHVGIMHETQGLSGRNDIAEDGKYVTEGFYDPSALLTVGFPGDNSWITVGAKKNIPSRTQEKHSSELASNTNKKQRKKKKGTQDVASMPPAPPFHSPAAPNQNVWNPHNVTEDWEVGIPDTENFLNYDDEFPSLTAAPKPRKPQPSSADFRNQAAAVAIQNSEWNNPGSSTYVNTEESPMRIGSEPDEVGKWDDDKTSDRGSMNSETDDEPIPEWATNTQDNTDWEALPCPSMDAKPTLAEIAETLYDNAQEDQVMETAKAENKVEMDYPPITDNSNFQSHESPLTSDCQMQPEVRSCEGIEIPDGSNQDYRTSSCSPPLVPRCPPGFGTLENHALGGPTHTGFCMPSFHDASIANRWPPNPTNRSPCSQSTVPVTYSFPHGQWPEQTPQQQAKWYMQHQTQTTPAGGILLDYGSDRPNDDHVTAFNNKTAVGSDFGNKTLNQIQNQDLPEKAQERATHLPINLENKPRFEQAAQPQQIPSKQMDTDQQPYQTDGSFKQVSAGDFPSEEDIRNATNLCAQQIATLAGLHYQRSLIESQKTVKDTERQTEVDPIGIDPFQRLLNVNFGSSIPLLSTPISNLNPEPNFPPEDVFNNESPLQFTMDDTEDDESTKDSGSEYSSDFPKFHTSMPEEWPFTKPPLNMDTLEALRLETIRQWRRELSNPDDVMHTDYHYYYSTLSEQSKQILDKECQNVGNIANHFNSAVPSQASCPTSFQSQNTKPPNPMPVGHPAHPAPAEETLHNGVRWTSKSSRWRKRFLEMLQNPNESTQVVGCIRVPNDQEVYCLRNSSPNTTLGLLLDGSEVAVTKVRLDQLPEMFANVNGLLSEEADHLFLVKYLAVEQKGQYCYIAKELCEYTLDEYIRILHLNRRLDPLSSDRLVWQLLKGLKHLHDNCKMVHHNLRPSNILVDKSGKLKLADFGLRHSVLERVSNQTLPEQDRRCWQPCEVLVSNSDACYTAKSDVQVSGMLIYYILSGGSHPYGKSPFEIETNICRNWHQLMYISEEANDMVLSMLSYTPLSRPTVAEALRHPYFWSEEKRFRFLLIIGSDILKELKGGTGGTSVTDHVNIIYGPAVSADWLGQIDPLLIREMNMFRQYRNSIPELVLFIYNCCLHFDKLSADAREILDDPCKYFNTRFPTLFMAIYRILRTSETVTSRKCYMSFF